MSGRIRRLLQRLLRIESPSGGLQRQLERDRADVEGYLQRLAAVAKFHGFELTPEQLDVYRRAFVEGQRWRAANPALGARVKYPASFEGAKPETGPNA